MPLAILGPLHPLAGSILAQYVACVDEAPWVARAPLFVTQRRHPPWQCVADTAELLRDERLGRPLTT